jgi:hypothetical protein
MKNVRMSSIMGVMMGSVMTFVGVKEAISCVNAGNIVGMIVPILIFGLGIVAFIIVGMSDRQYDKARRTDNSLKEKI